MRKAPGIEMYIAGKKEVPAVGAQFDDIVDCTMEGATHPFLRKVLHVHPTGSNNHQWTINDLDTIVELVDGALSQGRRVLIHCERGVSRSTCAAAAVLLYTGLATNVDLAVGLVQHPDRVPVKTALASLKHWWERRQQMKLF